MPRLAALAAVGLLSMVAPARAADQTWATIKGKVVFDGDPPAPRKVDLTKFPQCKDKDGQAEVIDDLVVDPKTKGVRWAVAFLVAADGKVKTEIPVHPSLKEVKEKQLTLDQPCCTFLPHVVCLREGQSLLVKNSASFPHNANVQGDGAPEGNNSIPAGGSKELVGWKATLNPATIACNIHPWMRTDVYTFKHPYFAVTDEKGEFTLENVPTGKYFLVVRHDKVGYVNGLSQEKRVLQGEPIEIKEGENAFTFKLTLPKEEK
jgi:hypothetical protein